VEFNLADLFESVVSVVPEKDALVTGTRRRTFRELDRRANRLANYFRRAGIGRGDHIGLHLYNGVEYL
jgi:non-ribosomal peptide synthetase component E (peptide arylation enzyme)